jgi:hypothetical protein
MAGGRDRGKLVDGVIKQLELVRAALGDDDTVPAHAALSFVAADWPLLGAPSRPAACTCSGQRSLPHSWLSRDHLLRAASRGYTAGWSSRFQRSERPTYASRVRYPRPVVT